MAEDRKIAGQDRADEIRVEKGTAQRLFAWCLQEKMTAEEAVDFANRIVRDLASKPDDVVA
jgi:hypothetical protein